MKVAIVGAGKLGIKVWIYKGEVLPTRNRQVAKEGK